MSKQNDTHIAVRQCLANELGITKELVRELVESRVDKIVEKKIKSMMSNKSLETMIAHRIRHRSDKNLLANGYTDQKFDNYIRYCIEQNMKRLIDEMYEVSVRKREPTNE
jgi:uncharacterized membrane protein YheB (UPF0754 family)